MSARKAICVHLTIAKKIEILDLLRKGKSKKEVCLQYKLASSSLSTILRDKNKLREEYEENKDDIPGL